jgi:RNA polymerase sigma-70 factor (ECF subfamily)
MADLDDEQRARLDAFLASIQLRALRTAQFAVGSRDDALDLVQHAMLELARRYAARPPAEWAPLFHRILHSGILQFHRRRRRQAHWLGWCSTDAAILEAVPDPAPGAQRLVEQDQTMTRLEQAVRQLPLRQQQAVMLRVWEGLDVAATAQAMRCGQGSVKTHLSRALAGLRKHLGEDA